jgi:hypothetical protein
LWLIGSVVALFGGNTGFQIVRSQRNSEIIRNEALAHIHRNCPADLGIGPGARPRWVGVEAWERLAAEHDAKVLQCERAKEDAQARVKLAERRLEQAFDQIPKAAAAVVGAAVMAANAPIAFTPPVIAAAGGAGAAAAEVVKGILAGNEPQLGAVVELVNKVDDANKIAVAEAKRQAEAAAAAAAAPAAQGGRTYRRKTKKRVVKKRVTRRKTTFSY